MSFLGEVIFQLFGENSQSVEIRSIGGGCIHHAGMFEHSRSCYFLKWNRDAAQMFDAEYRGLNLIHKSNSVYTPVVIGKGKAEGIDYLCLEYVSSSTPLSEFWSDFGRQLADMHQNTDPNFGLDHHNFIGSLPQSNRKHQNWNEFFINERLIPQLQIASNKGLIDSTLKSNFESLFTKLSELIPKEIPSLLHGDLWSGNFLVGDRGQPVIFDPAVYYGNREAELSFTRMFGGFEEEFYQSYQEAYPMQPGYKERVDIFNLYPLLVHVNLFGSSYLSGIRQTLSRFI